MNDSIHQRLRPPICHFYAGDRCAWCRNGSLHYHQPDDRRSPTLYEGGRPSADPVAALVAAGLRSPTDRPRTFRETRR